MLRVGIITFHCSFNYGSALQAYALQTAVEMTGNTSTIIDYRSPDFDQYKLLPFSHPRRMARNLLSFNGMMRRCMGFRSFWKKKFRLTTERYDSRTVSSPSLVDQFDAFICGSDQIWNLDCTHGVVEPFFLSFAGNKRRIAYAPSLAHTSFDEKYFDRQKIAELLAKFDYISVREEETVQLFQPLVDKEIEVTLDPTLLLDADCYSDIIGPRVQDGPFIFVYLLRECPELIESASKISEKRNVTVIYVSEIDLPIPNSTNLFGAGPDTFLSLISNAEIVLTNSFHATVFSILFHTPFRVFACDKSSSRMRELLKKLGIPERCALSVDTSPVVDVEWEAIDRSLADLRKSSWDFLRRALS